MKTVRMLALALLITTPLFANESLALQAGDTLSSVLKRQVGQKVQLQLNSGEKITGKLETVGESTLHITSIVGFELFEAVVVINEISAVITRSPGK